MTKEMAICNIQATHPTHRDIPSIFQVRMITMGGPAEGKKQLYPKYTTNDYASGFATTLSEAEAMVRKDVAWWKAQEYRHSVFCYFITEKPIDMMAYDESDDSYTVIDGPRFEYHVHVSAMRVFAPHFHIPIRIERRFKGYS